MRAWIFAGTGLFSLAIACGGCAGGAVEAAPRNPSGPASGSGGSRAPSSTPPRSGATSVAAVALTGPQASRGEACTARAPQIAGNFGWTKTTCDWTPIPFRPGAPFAGADVMLLKQASPSDPRLADTGAFLVAVHTGSGWYTTADVVDAVNSGAGHTYVVSVSPLGADVVRHPGGAASRVVLRLLDVTESICNLCPPGPERDKRTPVKTRQRILVCVDHPQAAPVCTPPIELHEQAKVTLSTGDVLSVTQPATSADGATFPTSAAYAITFP